MVVFNNKHFYICEPTQLVSGEVFVPLFFYKCRDNLHSKCTTPQFYDKMSSKGTYITIPSDLKFHDELLTIDVSQFDLIYSEIRLEDGQYLSDVCGNLLFGMSDVTLLGFSFTY
jgi:hypothetical protein